MKEIALPTTGFAENAVVNFPHQQSGVFYHLLEAVKNLVSLESESF